MRADPAQNRYAL